MFEREREGERGRGGRAVVERKERPGFKKYSSPIHTHCHSQALTGATSTKGQLTAKRMPKPLER